MQDYGYINGNTTKVKKNAPSHCKEFPGTFHRRNL